MELGCGLHQKYVVVSSAVLNVVSNEEALGEGEMIFKSYIGLSAIMWETACYGKPKGFAVEEGRFVEAVYVVIGILFILLCKQTAVSF